MVLDTHVGSASSLIACRNTGHKFVGFELSEHYFNNSRKYSSSGGFTSPPANGVYAFDVASFDRVPFFFPFSFIPYGGSTIARSKYSQGCDIRIMTEEKISYLQQMKIKQIHFAWDRYEDKEIIIPKFEEFKRLYPSGKSFIPCIQSML